MRRQRILPLDGFEPLRALWWDCPEQEREKAVEMFSRLLAQAVHRITEKEDDSDERPD